MSGKDVQQAAHDLANTLDTLSMIEVTRIAARPPSHLEIKADRKDAAGHVSRLSKEANQEGCEKGAGVSDVRRKSVKVSWKLTRSASEGERSK